MQIQRGQYRASWNQLMSASLAQKVIAVARCKSTRQTLTELMRKPLSLKGDSGRLQTFREKSFVFPVSGEWHRVS